jgi:protein-disulfide isomerase
MRNTLWRDLTALAGTAALVSAIVAVPAATQETPVSQVAVTGVVPGPQGDTLAIAGQYFGERPFVTLDLVPLEVLSASDTAIVATVPIAVIPPGEYLLTVSRGPAPEERASFDITLGAEPGATGAAAAPPSGSPASDPGVADVPPLTSAEQDERAALVGDRVITIAEVDREWRRRDPANYIGLLREIHEIRWSITDTMVADELFALEAAARGLTPEALLEEEVPRRTVTMPETAVRSLYQSLGDAARGATFEQMRPALLAWLEEVTGPELAKLNYREELMKLSTRTEMLLVPPQVTVERTAQDATLGPETAEVEVEVVAFGDFQNEGYATLAQLFGRVRETYGDRVRLVFKHLPEPSRPEAIQAAQAAQCANIQDQLWAYHDALLARPGVLDSTLLRQVANDIDLDQDRFDACLTSDESREVIIQALEEAVRYGIQASPSLLVNGRLAPQPPPFLPPFEFLTRVIEEELLRQSRGRSPSP